MTKISGIKLVALDLDGTMFGKESQIAPRTREAITEARVRGVQVVIVTGRMHQSAVPYARELGLDGLPVVSYNGAMVVEHPSERLICHEPVPVETAKSLAAYCEARGYYLQAYVNDKLYVPELGEKAQSYMQLAQVEAHPVGSLFFWLKEPSTKLLLIDDAARIPQIQAEVAELLGPQVSAFASQPQYLEVVNCNVSKGAALAAVASSLGVAREAVMAIGDGMNDMPMLTWAGTSFAMAHAPEALRQAATHVTTRGPGEGIVEAFEKMGLIG